MSWKSLPTAAACILALLLSGCSENPLNNEPSSSPAETDGFHGEVPEFTGPWASSFTSMYEIAGSNFERQVLKDEQVTDQEYAEAIDRFTECLTAFGHTDIVFDEAGGFGMQSPDGLSGEESADQVEQCSNESGEAGVNAMYHWVRRNPENLDEHTIMAACLVRKQAVDPSYSASDFGQDDQTENFPYLDGHGRTDLIECQTDPLGLFE